MFFFFSSTKFCEFFRKYRDDHPEGVLSSMQRIMALLLEESEDVREDLLLLILSKLGRNKSVSAFFFHIMQLMMFTC